MLCFVDRGVFTGLVPQLEADLKVERKAAKKKMAAAEAAGDDALAAFYNNVQNSIKVIMNGLYGGFGAARGGIFPDGQAIASAITATGRGWICKVKATVEELAWLTPRGEWGVAQQRPDDARAAKIIYGDVSPLARPPSPVAVATRATSRRARQTDSVFVHLPGLTLQAAAEFGDAVSRHFSDHVLPYPQKLEFEKVYLPFVLYKKKMYSGMKFEGDYGEGAHSKLHSRGIALVRRDNAKLVRTVMKRTLEVLLRTDTSPDDAVAAVAAHAALVEASARSLHDDVRPPEHLPVEQFVLSGGISKALDEYDVRLLGPSRMQKRVCKRPSPPSCRRDRPTARRALRPA